MEELVKRIADNVGVDTAVATRAIGIMLNFLQKDGPSDKVKALIDNMPGSEAAIAAAEAEGSGGMFGMGGVMGVGSKLMGLGLGMGQVQGVAREVIGYAREKVGDDTVNEIVGAIPGLSQFV